MVASCGATSDAGKSSACLPGWAISGVWSCVTNISSRTIWLSRSWVASSSCFVPIYEMTSSRHEHVLDGAHAENVGSRGAVDIAARGLVHQGYCRRTGKPAHQCFHQGHIASLVRDNRSLSMTEDRPAAY